MLTTKKRSQISNKPVIYRREDFIQWLSDRQGVDFSGIAEHLPVLIVRSRYGQIAKEVGLPLSKSSLENLDSQGLGPRRLT